MNCTGIICGQFIEQFPSDLTNHRRGRMIPCAT
jgi:hypothetical protein